MKIQKYLPSLSGVSEVTFATVITRGCFPEGAYLTTNALEFFYYHDKWQLPQQPRMDGVVRKKRDDNTLLEVIEMNKLAIGDEVVKGHTTDGSEGIFLTQLEQKTHTEAFSFMTNTVSRERRVDYAQLANLLQTTKDTGGETVWVLGPAVIHSGGIDDMQWLITHGYVNVLFGGNAVGVHDIEHALLHTSLGNNDNSEQVVDGHRNHLEAINTIREIGSIHQAVTQGVLTTGIMHACVTHKIPFVLAGSIRDDGPLPDTISDAIQAQNLMRSYTQNATTVVMLASALHSIATGNMTPTYHVVGDDIHPVSVICVDSDEFTAVKLADRGTSQVYPVIANVRDFLGMLVNELKKHL